MIEHPDPALGTSPAPYRSMCTDCGISRSSDPGRCGRACQFIAPDYPGLEAQVHGRSRHSAADQDELFFGVHTKMWRAVRQPAVAGAQWTGITTLMGEQLLSGGHVDAVLAVVPDPDDRWKPKPALLTAPEEMAHARGMRMGYAPLLALLETARAHGFARLAVIGIPCQVYALRALERELGFDELFVIGTPCSDNTTTDHFHTFLAALTDEPDTVSYLEFRPDYQVEMRFDDGARRLIPFIKLPLSQLPENFFPLTCQTCVDYTNALSDLTVGYMAADGEQWLIVRNARGARLLNLISDHIKVRALTSRGRRQGAVRGFLANVMRAGAGLPARSAPSWLKPILAVLMPLTGPRGLEFARARLEMKALETIVHLRRVHPKRLRAMVPEHVWALAKPYGLMPEAGERETNHSSSDRRA